MKNEVFITATASFFPNNPIDNNSIEDYLGLISGQHSRVKNLVLRQNGIKNRYYALNTKQEMTPTNTSRQSRSGISRTASQSANTSAKTTRQFLSKRCAITKTLTPAACRSSAGLSRSSNGHGSGTTPTKSRRAAQASASTTRPTSSATSCR